MRALQLVRFFFGFSLCHVTLWISSLGMIKRTLALIRTYRLQITPPFL